MISMEWTLLRFRPISRFSRKDLDDAVYKTKKEKFNAVVQRDRGSSCKGTAGTGRYDYNRDF